MKRTVAIVVLVCISSFICAPAFSLGNQVVSPTLEASFRPSLRSGAASTSYEPYSDDEFPRWALDLRRAECIFFGGIPITLPVTYLVSNLLDADLTFLQAVGIACSVSAVITLVDYILGVLDED
ncbi:MAG: hypothetical protein IJ863_00580 [Spirochaetales bacterium]|nr:hypothetical protein [Spirochaetales bacterium]